MSVSECPIPRIGLGPFGDADSGGGKFRQWWSQMFCTMKSVFEIFQALDYKRCLLANCFCCHPEGQRGFPPAGSLEGFSATVTLCGTKYGL